MQIKNIIVLLDEFQQRKTEEARAKELFIQRLEALFEKTRNRTMSQAMITVTTRLDDVGVSGKKSQELAEKVSLGMKAFKRQELGIMHRKQALSFSDIRGESLFTKILVVLREFCAEDIADKISCADAVDIVLEHFLFHL